MAKFTISSSLPKKIEPPTIIFQDRIVDRPIFIDREVVKEVEKRIEVLVDREVVKEVPVEKLVFVDRAVDVIREVQVPIEVIKYVDLVVEKIVNVDRPVYLDKIIEVIKEVEKPVEVIKYIDRVVEKEVILEKPTNQIIEKIVHRVPVWVYGALVLETALLALSLAGKL